MGHSTFAGDLLSGSDQTIVWIIFAFLCCKPALKDTKSTFDRMTKTIYVHMYITFPCEKEQIYIPSTWNQHGCDPGFKCMFNKDIFNILISAWCSASLTNVLLGIPLNGDMFKKIWRLFFSFSRNLWKFKGNLTCMDADLWFLYL